jgi:tRNA1Val (adenine37-N6)-methyltransferase
MSERTSFKGWTIPGPRPDPSVTAELSPREGESLDALSGHFKIFQLKKGHRFSTDDVLAAWYGTSWCPTARRVLDLGSGIGSVGMIAAWRLPGAHFVTVEAQEISVELARRSARYNGLTDRYDIRLGDLRDPDVLAGEEPFDLVLGSPPYWPLSDGTPGNHPQKVACRFEMRGDVADYVATASEQLAPGGVFACVFPVHPEGQHQRVRDAAAAHDMTILRFRTVFLREGRPQSQIGLFLMVRDQDLPEWMRGEPFEEPPLIIRHADGSLSREYSAVKISFGFPP